MGRYSNLFQGMGVLLFCLFGGASCHTTVKETVPAIHQPKPQFSSKDKIYVALPMDAFYKKQEVMDSGSALQSAIMTALQKYSSMALAARKVETETDALERAAAINAHYLVFASILRWEDHPTEFNGIRDYVVLRLQVFDAQTNQQVHEETLEARSKWLTDGGDKPSDLLPDILKPWAGGFFHPVYKPSF